jgi:amino acid transporter
MNSDPVKQAWQASVEIAGAPPIEEVRKGADKFYRYVKWRNIVEYVACIVVIVVGTFHVFTWPHILHKVGSAMLVAAAIYAPWQLHRRASAVPPEMALGMPIYAFLRGQLVRQRDALKNIFWWYVLPFLPGIALVFAGNGLDPEFEAAGPPIWVRWLAFVGIFLLFGFIIWLNRLGARRLQKRIDEIDALTGRNE